MIEPRLTSVLATAVEAIETVSLRYAVVGGLAVGAWGVVRATRDVDLYVDLGDGHRKPLKQELEKRGFDVPAMDGELQRFGVFRARHTAAGVFVDMFSAVGPLGEAILSRCRQVDLQGKRYLFASPEDLAVLKAFSDRERDHDDLAKLLAVRRDEMDLDYIHQWAKTLDLSIGSDEVSERVRQALERRTRRNAAGPASPGEL